MTDAELKALILGDPEAKASADAGRDGDCATRASALAPKVSVLSMGSFLTIARDTSLALVDRLIRSVRAAIAGGSLALDEMQWALRNTGVDISNPETQAALDMLASLEIPGGLTADDAAQIKAVCLQSQVITSDDVSRVWAEFRPEGRIQ